MGLWAMLVPWVWVLPGLASDPVFWHAHELTVGMAGTALGGYLLIALPNWTDPKNRHLIGRLALGLLVLAWILGRGAMLFGVQGLPLLVCVSLMPLGFSAVLVPPLCRARVWQKLPFAMAPTILAATDMAWLTMRQSGVSDLPFGLALVMGFALLLSVIGGRAVPAFINSRFQATGCHARPLPAIGALASGLILLSLVLWVAQWPALSGVPLLMAGGLQSLRLFAWGTRRLFSHLDLLMLYLAWAWLVAGMLLLGMALLAPDMFSLATMLHGLTIGAMGSMIMAVTARAFMARAPGQLRATAAHVAAFALITIAAVLRLAVPAAEFLGLMGLHWSVLAWSLGWAIYLIPLLRGLAKPSPRPVLSANRLKT